MKICSLYGAGFYYIPGTDMCLKVGGWARMEIGQGYNGSLSYGSFKGNGQNRATNDETWRYKGVVTVDSRNQTEYGTVRSYVAIGVSNNFVGSSADAATTYAPRWFMQWAGFTFGHAQSFYDFYSDSANQYGSVINGSDSGDAGWDVVAYTAQFGNGLSATISAEEQRKTQIFNATSGTLSFNGAATTSSGYEGQDYPDVVGNLRIDQAWGSAQIMGALHNVAAGYYGAAEGSGHPSDKLGFVIGGGLKLNAPMFGPGDYFIAEVDYTQGALRYLNQWGASFNWAGFDGNQVAYGVMSDAVVGGTSSATGTGLELTSAWAVQAAYTHQWNKAWKSTLWGAYEGVNYNSNANAMLCVNEGDATAGVANAGCNNNWNVWGLGLRTQWNVTSDFYLGLEVMYQNLNSAQTSTGTIGLASANLPSGKPTGAYTIEDQDIWAFRFRAHKDFYP